MRFQPDVSFNTSKASPLGSSQRSPTHSPRGDAFVPPLLRVKKAPLAAAPRRKASATKGRSKHALTAAAATLQVGNRYKRASALVYHLVTQRTEC